MKSTDIGVLQCRNRTSLPLEAFPMLRARRMLCRKNLNGDRAVQPRVARLVHFSHSPRANERHDFVGSQPSARLVGNALCDGSLQEFPRNLSLGRKKRFNVLPKCSVVRTLAIEKSGSFGDGDLHRSVEQFTDLLPAFRRHLFTHPASRGAAKLEP